MTKNGKYSTPLDALRITLIHTERHSGQVINLIKKLLYLSKIKSVYLMWYETSELDFLYSLTPKAISNLRSSKYSTKALLLNQTSRITVMSALKKATSKMKFCSILYHNYHKIFYLRKIREQREQARRA